MGTSKEETGIDSTGGAVCTSFFDYLAPDLPVKTIGELRRLIVRRFAALFSGGVPVEGHMGGVAFCATEQPGGGVRVHWVQVDRQRIPVDATV